MTESQNNQSRTGNVMAGGAPLALLTVAGPFIAGAFGISPSIGFLVGLGLGVAIAVVIWLKGPR